MYRITLKGRNIDPIFLEDGEDILKLWSENKLPARLVVKNTAINSSEIKTIQLIEKTKAESQNNENKEGDEKYREFRTKMLSLSAEKRGNIMRIPNMIWASHGNGVMPDDVKQKIKSRQVAYFNENPKCVYANPKIYRDLIPIRVREPKVGNLNQLNMYLHTSVLCYIENLIKTDLIYSAR